MTMILKYVCDWFDQCWVDLCTFYSVLFEIKSLKYGIILQSKKCSLMGNYLTEQEGFLNKKLSYKAREV
jgi:hypothetical protein